MKLPNGAGMCALPCGRSSSCAPPKKKTAGANAASCNRQFFFISSVPLIVAAFSLLCAKCSVLRASHRPGCSLSEMLAACDSNAAMPVLPCMAISCRRSSSSRGRSACSAADADVRHSSWAIAMISWRIWRHCEVPRLKQHRKASGNPPHRVCDAPWLHHAAKPPHLSCAVDRLRFVAGTAAQLQRHSDCGNASVRTVPRLAAQCQTTQAMLTERFCKCQGLC